MKYQTMKTVLIGISALCLSVDMHVCNATLLVNKQIVEKMPVSQWRGKKVAFLGDSITDKSHVGTTKNYWQYLEEMLGIEAWVYGINGHQWSDIWEQAQRLKAEKGNNVDAIIIFAGTNDYNCGVPLGEWYSYELSNVEVSGPQIEQRVRRVPQMDESTFRGRINRVLSYLKSNFPQQQIILLTPIHRAQAHFSADNIQPEEAFPNRLGLYINDYVEVVKEAANIWAVPVIDLNSLSGLYPMEDSHAIYFHDKNTDRLHPNVAGHYRMAISLFYQLLGYPSDFK